MAGGMRALFLILLTGLTQLSWAEDDKKCLMYFKASVNDPSNSLGSWDFANYTSEGTACSFNGVQCWNGQENKVLGLNLERAGLSGPFPRGLGACSSLTYLNLAGNDFTGPLPLDLCKQMPDLTTLDLSQNQFEGNISSALLNCNYLSTLSLHQNHLSGQIPWELGFLSRLISLNLSSNALSGRIPDIFTNRSVVGQLPFSTSAFANNPLLCGPPLVSECRQAESHRNWIVGGSLVGALILNVAWVLAFLRFWPFRRATRSRHQPELPNASPLKSWWKSCILQKTYTPHDTQSLPMFETHLMRLTWGELQHATATFSPANIIGKGGCSTVYKGRLLSGRMITVKLLCNGELGFGLHEPTQLFETELAVLGKLRHRNLVKILGYFYSLESMAIIMEYMPGGSLDALLHASNNIMYGWKERLSILVGVAEGLAYLHHEYDGKESVIHADLKPGNVLLDENMEAHIADFGISTVASAISTHNSKGLSKGQVLPVPVPCWSLGYTAPECVQQGVVSRKGDVFSFGVIVLEVITGERPSSNKLKEGESLVEWVSKALEKGMMEHVIAPILLSPNELARWREDISATLRMGCSCVSLAHASRPAMSTVVTFLRQLQKYPTLPSVMCR